MKVLTTASTGKFSNLNSIFRPEKYIEKPWYCMARRAESTSGQGGSDLYWGTDKNSFLDMLALSNEGAFRKFAERIL